MTSAALPPLIGSVGLPGDKSCTQRALLLGAVAEGRTVARGALRAGDTQATADIVAALGARVSWQEAAAGGAGASTLSIEGVQEPASPRAPLDCRNAGTAARLLLGLLAGRRGRWTLDGDASLRGRPMDRVIAPLRGMGADIRGEKLPLQVQGAPLAGGRHEVATPSAQVKSALLLAGLCADGPTTVLQHVPTRDHTERWLPRFGARLEVEPGAVTVHPGRLAAARLDIPGDPSSAAFLVVAALLTPGSDVWLRGVGLWPRRTGFLRALERAGADVMVLRRAEAAPVAADAGASADPVGDLRAGASELRAFEIAPEDVPDLVDEIPVLALAAARAHGTSRFAGLRELRFKESDRIAGIAELLAAMGARVAVEGDALSITGVPALRAPSRRPRSDDHRLALTAAVAATSAGWPLPPLDAADISFPGFADVLGRLRPGA
jgi:3-phosphoshikimate 1-carboxyvinyltransferase